MNLYFLSGLGADKRVFQKLHLPESFHVHHIEWLPPEPNETLQHYVLRLLPAIDSSGAFSLVGLSFGGIIAMELSKICRPVQTVLLSSITGPSEMSAGMKRAGRWKLQRFIPDRFLLRPSGILYKAFGVTDEKGKKLLSDILSDTDPVFFRWALGQMSEWNNNWKPDVLLHLHGTNDRILPYHKNMNAVKVVGAGHLMVYTHSAIVSTLLSEHLLSATGR